MRFSRALLLILALFAAALPLLLFVSGSRAAGEAANSDRNTPITLVVDTTAGMGEAVPALAAAWDQVFPPASAPTPADHCVPAGACHTITATFRLISFRDQVSVVGESNDSSQVSTWLSSLPTGGDGSCPDDAFRALWTAARLTHPSPLSDTGALLLTDSTPGGGQPALARIINILAEQNVAVNSVVIDWCGDSGLPSRSMDYLAAGTGGLSPLFLSDSYTSGIHIALSELTTNDTLAVHLGGGEAFSDTVEIEVDSTVDVLDFAVTSLDEPCAHPYASDSCGLYLDPEGQGSGAGSLTVQVRDPGGNVIAPGVAGVQVIDQGNITYYRLDMDAYPGPKVGTFRVGISGVMVGYDLRASASSDVAAQLLSGHVLAAGGPQPIVVGLLLPAVQARAAGTPAPYPTEELFGAYNFHTGELLPLELKDDGQSGDGAAGDNIYGGMWQPSPGLWQLRVVGELDDGSTFRRVETAPIRVQRFQLSSPDDNQMAPGTILSHSFTLRNDETAAQSFELEISSSQGWAVTDTVPLSITVAPGDAVQIDVPVAVPVGVGAGTVEETSLTALKPGDNPLDSSTATVHTTAVDSWQIYLPFIGRTE